MKKYTQEELNKILELHQKWLNQEDGGTKADLSYADLSNLVLSYVVLSYVDLSHANLYRTDLSKANLHHADLSYSDLSRANLAYADLAYANLTYSYLSYSYLFYSNLRYANLSHSDLYGANLTGADLRHSELDDVAYNTETSFYALQCPEVGSFVGYKKAYVDYRPVLVKLLIPSYALRSSATTKKCRCNKALVLDISDIRNEDIKYEQCHSNYDIDFVYRINDFVEVDDFNEDRWNECSTGIHFFMTKEDAINY